MRRLVLYRRVDQEWRELASEAIEYAGERVTLRVELDGDGIHAQCPELGVGLMATDTVIASGHAGFRALGEARLLRLTITRSASAQAVNDRLVAERERVRAALAADLPDAGQVGEIALPEGFGLLDAVDLRSRGENDLLLRSDEGLLATDWEGRELWRLREPVGQVKVTAEPVRGSRRLYALVGREPSAYRNVRGGMNPIMLASQIVSLDAATGEELGRIDLPHDPEREEVRQYDFSCETGRLSSDEPGDFLIRQWRRDCGNGGRALWAFTGDLEPLWHARVSPAYGHHYAVRMADLTGDGREEIVAGGTTFDARGRVIAEHDLAHEMAEIRGAGHYDAVTVGHLAEEVERDPVAFLISGSAGVYVIDPLTGRTRSAHRIGHAQGQQLCRVRDDMPGMQVLVHTRWANFGILTLFSGLGERLWSVQPAHIPVAKAVRWASDGPEHIWVAATRESLALHDGEGRLVLPLEALKRAWGDRTACDVTASVLRRKPTGGDLLALTFEGRVLLFGPEA